MPLEIYRYHTADCKQELLKKRLPVSAHLAYTDCNCVIWIKGRTDTGYTPRRSTGIRDWKAAEALRNKLDAKSKDETVHGPTLADCCKRYIDSREHQITPKVKQQFVRVFVWLQEFTSARNVMFARELTKDLLEDFKTYGFPKSVGQSSKALYVNKLLAFLREAYGRGWTTDALAEQVDALKGKRRQVQPYSDQEVETIFAEAAKLNGGTKGFATCAATFVMLLRLMLEVGLRVSDAVRYNPRRCEKGERMWIYTFEPVKAKEDAETVETAEVFITDELKTAIDKCKWFSAKLPFAYRPPSEKGKTDYLAQAVYERMQEIGKRCKDADGNPIEDCRPHRLRHTFAIRKFEGWGGKKPMPLELVSKALYHKSVAVTEKYYKPWIKSRKLQLERAMYDTSSDFAPSLERD